MSEVNTSKTLSQLSDRFNAGNTKAPTSERAVVVQEVIDDLGFEQKDFKKLLFFLKDFTYYEIRSIKDVSAKFEKNPRALFWKLAREKRDEIVKEINH